MQHGAGLGRISSAVRKPTRIERAIKAIRAQRETSAINP